jgi:hypothetical protein
MKNIKMLFILLFFVSCNKTDTEIEQIKIDFVSGGGFEFSTNSATGRTFESLMLYIDFNKENYKNCNSIKLVGHLTAPNAATKCFLEIYNLTDSIIIPNSTISTINGNTWYESNNIIHDFPVKDIDLTLRLRSEHEGEWVSFSSASIYINFK